MEEFFFLGVSTSRSSVNMLFSDWCAALDVRAQMIGVDIPVGAPKERYQEFAREYFGFRRLSGGLVTSHKAALFLYCSSVFSYLTQESESLEEIGAVFRHAGALAADAPDVRSSRFVLAELLATAQWRDGFRSVVIFGAGGAGLALAVALMSLPEPPLKVVLTERQPERLNAVRRILERLNLSNSIEILSSNQNQALIDTRGSGTLFVNASGLGKDLPGSPVDSCKNIAKGSIVWDFNYRGDLLFLKQARAEATEKQLVIEDGWRYFISGWAHVLCLVFGKDCTDAVIRDFSRVAGKIESGR